MGCSCLGSLDACIPIYPLCSAPRPQGCHLPLHHKAENLGARGSCFHRRERVSTAQKQRLPWMEKKKATRVLGIPLPLLNCNRRVN